jgi:hypothetical protein
MQPNPTDGRLKFILKTYGQKKPEVVMSMVDVIAHTVGVDDWVQRLSDAAKEAGDDAFFKDLGVWSVNRIGMGRRARPGEEVYRPSPDLAATVVAMVSEMPAFKGRHQADPVFPWIAQQLAKRRVGELGNDTWSHKLRRGGTMLGQWYEAERPNLGQYDLDQAFAEAEEWSKEHGGEDVPQGEVVVDLSDGWTAQQLATKEQLDAEGEEMQHCVGSYCKLVQAGQTTIYSLRDKKGHPHVTIEVARKRVQQVRGKQNEKPDAKYQKYVDEFENWLDEQGIEVSIPADLRPWAELVERHVNDYDEEYLPDLAREWREATGSLGDAEAWMKMGLEPRMVEALRGENVTPDEYNTFPWAIMEKIHENGEPPAKLDELVKIAHMANLLYALNADRVSAPIDKRQLTMFDAEHQTVYPERPSGIPGRPGHDPTGEVAHHTRRGTRTGWPSVNFESWTSEWSRTDDDPKTPWLYPAEEWLDEDFTYEDWEDHYVGPWFLNYFTPEQATEWWNMKVEDGLLAVELRALRVTPELLEEVPDTQDSISEYDALMSKSRRSAWANKGLSREEANEAIERDRVRYAKVIAEQIARQIDDASVRRNPGKRTSKRRTSRRR